MQLHRLDNDEAGGDDLVQRAQSGDADAFERLVRRHYRQIFHIAYRWLGNRADAEDMTQSICIKLASALESYDGRASFSTWLHRVVFNAIHDWRRTEARRLRLVETVAAEATDSLRATQKDGLLVADIWRRVRELPEKQRDAVMLVYGQEMSQAEAAEIMGCKEITVSWHIHKARKALRDML